MGIVLTSLSSVLPVTVAQAKEWCTIEASNTSQDGVFAILIDGAVREIERFLGQSIEPAEWRLMLDCFTDAIEFPRGPVTEITAFTYLDATGVMQTVNPDAYVLDITSMPQRILRDPYHTWPPHYNQPGVITVEFKAGMEIDNFADIKVAILQIVAARFDDRANGAVPASVLATLRRIKGIVL